MSGRGVIKIGDYYLVKIQNVSKRPDINMFRITIPSELVKKYKLKKGEIVAIKDLGNARLELLLKPEINIRGN